MLAAVLGVGVLATAARTAFPVLSATIGRTTNSPTTVPARTV